MVGFFGLFDIYIVAFNVLLVFINILSVIGLGFILYTMCENNGLKGKAILSFVPVGNVYIMNELLGERVHEKVRKFLWIIYGLLYLISFVVGKFGIVVLIIFSYYMFLLLKEVEKNYLIHTLIGVVTGGISLPFSLYKHRNKKIYVTTRNMEEDESLSDIVINLRNRVENVIEGDNEKK